MDMESTTLSYRGPDEELQWLIQLHRGPPLCLSPGMARSQQGGPGDGPWPGPYRRAAELYLFKSPDLILHSSCLRSGRSGREAEAGEAHRPAGADRRADVVKSGSTGIKSWV